MFALVYFYCGEATVKTIEFFQKITRKQFKLNTEKMVKKLIHIFLIYMQISVKDLEKEIW